MKKFLTSVFMLSMVLFSMSVFDSCKDYDEDEYNDLLIQFDKNDANLRKWITANYATIAQLRDSIVAVLEAKHAEDKDEACEPSSASAAGAGIVSEPDIPDEMPSEDEWSFDQTNSPRAQNYDITGRLRDKIAGCDFLRKNLTPDEQVEELIESAIDPYNMSFLYQGWTPLW